MGGDDDFDDQSIEIYCEYKMIIKELLFNGADRNIESTSGKTALGILFDHIEYLSDEQLKSMSFILKDQTTCLCLMRHRPIKKVKKSLWVLFMGVLVNLAVVYLFYYELEMFFLHPQLLPLMHYILVIFSLVCFLFFVPTFVMASVMDAGHLEKKEDFLRLVSNFIDNEKDLMNLCTYCEVIKSETSFHCLFCGKCTELFDHHCPFINNCLGYRNYKFFLIFIFSYFLFLVALSAEVVRN